MKILTTAMCLVLATSLTACSSYSSRKDSLPRSHVSSRVAAEQYGRVTDIEVVSRKSRTSGGGAALGAVIGGVLGHQIGSGNGRDLATGAGVVGGAIAGNRIEKQRASDDEIYRITVAFEDGSREYFDYEHIEDLRVGDRVKLRGGQLERL